MAKLFSSGGITIYTNKNGQVITRAKPGPNKKMKTHPQYQMVRENGAAFGTASSIGARIRCIFRSWVKIAGDPTITNRLTKALMQVLKSVHHADSMKPKLADGNLSLLEGFQFNERTGIHRLFTGPYSVSVTQDNRQVRFFIPSFIPRTSVEHLNNNYPFFRLHPVIAVVNFETSQHNIITPEITAPLAWDDTPANAVELIADFEPADGNFIIAALGIEFFQGGCGKEPYYPSAGSQNAFTIIRSFKV